jgi:hypothetical protein
MATVAVDFDGVIHAYSRGYHDGTIYDGPVPGAFGALATLMERYAVVIFTARDVHQVAGWMRTHGPDEVTTEWTPPFWNTRGVLLVTNIKPVAVAYIDDRGIRFENWDQALTELELFPPLPAPVITTRRAGRAVSS